MADSALTATLVSSFDNGQAIQAKFSIATGAGNYVSGGNTVSLQVAGVKTNKAPLEIVSIHSTNGNPMPVFVKGTTLANGKLKMFTTTPGTELTGAAAMPAVWVADVVKLTVLLSK